MQSASPRPWLVLGLRRRSARKPGVFSWALPMNTIPSSGVKRPRCSIRRECLNQVVIFDERHLRGVLSSYFHYYHKTGTHLWLDKDSQDASYYPRNGRWRDRATLGDC
jgi:hypothetical protein